MYLVSRSAAHSPELHLPSLDHRHYCLGSVPDSLMPLSPTSPSLPLPSHPRGQFYQSGRPKFASAAPPTHLHPFQDDYASPRRFEESKCRRPTASLQPTSGTLFSRSPYSSVSSSPLSTYECSLVYRSTRKRALSDLGSSQLYLSRVHSHERQRAIARKRGAR